MIQRRLLAVIAGTGLLVVGAVWGPSLAGSWHPAEKRFPVQGIDVSHHQGRIRWRLLPGQGVDFAYIKATEGGDHIDKAFAANWRAARAAGIRRGAYHFFTLCRRGAEQAANFVRTVPAEAGTLPPAVDLEYLGNCSNKVAPPQLHAELASYLRIVEDHYSQPAVLYLTEEFDRAYGVSQAFDRPLWLRRIILEPDFGARRWAYWQASNFRRLRGIDGRVDWNVAAR